MNQRWLKSKGGNFRRGIGSNCYNRNPNSTAHDKNRWIVRKGKGLRS